MLHLRAHEVQCSSHNLGSVNMKWILCNILLNTSVFNFFSFKFAAYQLRKCQPPPTVPHADLFTEDDDFEIGKMIIFLSLSSVFTWILVKLSYLIFHLRFWYPSVWRIFSIFNIFHHIFQEILWSTGAILVSLLLDRIY